MSARSLTPRQSQTAAVLILLVMLVVVAFLIVGPLIAGFQERAAQREQLALQYSANVRNIAAIPRLRRMAGAHEQLLGDFLLEAPDAATAGEALRQRLQASIIALGGEFRGGEDIAPAAGGEAAVRITARLSEGQLSQLLASVQNSKPYLTITSVVVGADEALVTGQASALDVQIEASIPYRPAAKR
ncbi:type II secretion system protein GspM [Novosphingobium sp.]|uniref:type II secretion system protein GspM n=1 Tax=Novosphingobium sp. TaxID=1874826 RepID=UPI00260C3CC8|nr:type II secretion system protein GspM [Novosphingobium sp.]